MSRPVEALISRAALRHNFQQVKQHAGRAKVLAVVKANAYGHGAIEVAKTLTAVDGFAVASIDEGLSLRKAGITQPILLLGGIFNVMELQDIAAHDFSVALNDHYQLSLLKEAKLVKPIKAWLHIDTAMHNLGFTPLKVPAVMAEIAELPQCDVVTLMTHFANADLPHDPTTQQQMAVFQQIANTYELPCSLANSAGILKWQQSIADWVRPGLMLYGATSIPYQKGRDYDLQPVMTLQSKLIAIHQLNAGEPIGYGGTWTAPGTMLVGTVAIGYGDGYPRHAKNGTPVLINGVRTQVVGTVAMDLITVDLRSIPHAQIGDSVTLWGEQLPVEDVAASANTIAHHCFANLNLRIPRVYS